MDDTALTLQRRRHITHRDDRVSRPGVETGRVWTGDGPVRLSVIMPAYNEEGTIAWAARSVLETEYPCEIELIVVDDGSHDGTRAELAAISDPRLTVTAHPRNFGKGAALFTGAALATGTHMLPFDADLEYSPDDIPPMLHPVIKGRCDVVYGTRLFGANTVYQSYHYALGNKLTTLAANLMFNAYLSDLHTCFKLVPLAMFRDLPLRETGFGLDTEITASLLARGVRPFEVPISYHSRSHEDGKKITWKDGVQCLGVLGRVRIAKEAGRRRARRAAASALIAEDDVRPVTPAGTVLASRSVEEERSELA